MFNKLCISGCCKNVNLELMNNLKSELIGSYPEYVEDKLAQKYFSETVKYCVAGTPTSEITKTKIGGYPELPPSFELPELTFFGQIDFSEFEDDNYPEKGLLSIFMKLQDLNGQLIIPSKPEDVKGYYFENTDELDTVKDESILSKHLVETYLNLKQYLDFPEFGDPSLPDKYLDLDPEGMIRFGLIPHLFSIENSPSFLINCYPTDDAVNTFLEWYINDKGIQLSNLNEVEFNLSKTNYTCLLWTALTDLGSLQLENEYSDFGGISIGIRESDLQKLNFSKLLFKYTIS